MTQIVTNHLSSRRPQLEWRSDSADADRAAGTAIWRHVSPAGQSRVTAIRMESFSAAHEVSKLIDAAWSAGVDAGRDELAGRIERALEQGRT